MEDYEEEFQEELSPTTEQQSSKESLSEQSFESALYRLEQIVGSLNNGRAPLAEALTLFEEGAGLLKYCTLELDKAEETVKLLTDTGANNSPQEQAMPPSPEEKS